MDNPLSKEQEELRGKNISSFSTDQLHEWIEACEKMAIWVKTNKARRSWIKSGEKAEFELQKRLIKQGKSIYDLLREEGIQFEVEEDESTAQLWNEWRSKFKAHYLTMEDCQWHTFCDNIYENYLEKQDAEDRYKQLLVNEYFIIIPDEPAIRCFSNRLPELEKVKSFAHDFGVVMDLYVCHKNVKWTFIVTHEDEFGPYYAE